MANVLPVSVLTRFVRQQAESVDFTEMRGILAFGVQHGTRGFKGKLWELIICPDLSADLRDSLIADMIAAHSIT